MIARKKGKNWEICYRCPGHPKPFYERFPTLEEANVRIAEIERDKARGTLRPPLKSAIGKGQEPTGSRGICVADLMDEFVSLYGLNHWSVSTLSCAQHRIDHYIKPFIGQVYVQDITTHFLDRFYNDLLSKPAIVQKGHKKKGTVAPSVIQKVHDLIRNALNQAVTWGYIPSNPAMNCSPPTYKSEAREVWSEDTAQQALALCKDPLLKTAMLLAIGCSMRIGEILGLTWANVELSPDTLEKGDTLLHIRQELKRADKTSLEKLKGKENCKVFFTFPEQINSQCKTSLVLKEPKTKSSVRTVYLPQTVAAHLLKVKEQQEEQKAYLEEGYQDYGLVVAQEIGTPVEERFIAKRFKDFIAENNLPPVVFHSLRHCSTSIKLKLSGGDIKAVQGDTGHAQARMVTEVYSHMQDEDRRVLARKVENQFFQKNSQTVPETPQDSDVAQAHALLESNPELAKLLLALKATA